MRPIGYKRTQMNPSGSGIQEWYGNWYRMHGMCCQVFGARHLKKCYDHDQDPLSNLRLVSNWLAVSEDPQKDKLTESNVIPISIDKLSDVALRNCVVDF